MLPLLKKTSGLQATLAALHPESHILRHLRVRSEKPCLAHGGGGGYSFHEGPVSHQQKPCLVRNVASS